MKRSLIIANGILPPATIVRHLAKHANYIVCADGGSRHASRLHIRPDIILGDLDSHNFSTRKTSGRVPLLRLPDQNDTDLQKAIAYLISRNCGSIDIVGAFGNRIDHCTVALGCFSRYRRQAHLRMFDSQGVLTFVDRRIRFVSQIGERISLIPFNRCNGITTTNLRYPLRNETLAPGLREGISNESVSTRVAITCSRGVLLLYRPLSSSRPKQT